MVFQTWSFIENRRGNYCRSRRIRTRPVTLLPCDNIQSMEKDYKVVHGVGKWRKDRFIWYTENINAKYWNLSHCLSWTPTSKSPSNSELFLFPKRILFLANFRYLKYRYRYGTLYILAQYVNFEFLKLTESRARQRYCVREYV